jgi:hypothetical protein
MATASQSTIVRFWAGEVPGTATQRDHTAPDTPAGTADTESPATTTTDPEEPT